MDAADRVAAKWHRGGVGAKAWATLLAFPDVEPEGRAFSVLVRDGLIDEHNLERTLLGDFVIAVGPPAKLRAEIDAILEEASPPKVKRPRRQLESETLESHLPPKKEPEVLEPEARSLLEEVLDDFEKVENPPLDPPSEPVEKPIKNFAQFKKELEEAADALVPDPSADEVEEALAWAMSGDGHPDLTQEFLIDELKRLGKRLDDLQPKHWGKYGGEWCTPPALYDEGCVTRR